MFYAIRLGATCARAQYSSFDLAMFARTQFAVACANAVIARVGGGPKQKKNTTTNDLRTRVGVVDRLLPF